MLQWLSPVIHKVKNRDGHRRLALGRDSHGRKRYKLSAFHGIFLTMVRIRKGFDIKHLSFLFNISQSHVSRVFTLWVNVLDQCFNPLLKWPDQDVACANIPKPFASFPRTCCITDYTEFAMEKPFRPTAQKQTWSFYKHGNTAKLLVAIRPCGVITFISKVFVGSVSDVEIVKKSGFLNLIRANDDVMADRDFNIRHLMLERKAPLNIPAFSKGSNLSMKAFKRSRRIASVRIDVERAIRRMKCFKILSGIIPLKLRLCLDQILKVVSVLSNLDKSLC